MLKFILSTLLGTTYGLSLYLAAEVGALVGAVSISFICLSPFIIGVFCGAVSAVLAPRSKTDAMLYSLIMSVLVCILVGIIPLLFAVELIICVIMGMVFFAPILITTAIMTAIFITSRNLKNQEQAESSDSDDLPPFNYKAMGILVLPLLFFAIEAQFQPPSQTYTVAQTRIIQANAATVWQTMVNVPEIKEGEQDYTIFHKTGVPRPVEAHLVGEGVGAIRYARYDNGLTLKEPITVWEENKRLIFAVIVDEDAPRPFNQVGGDLFDVIEVGFEIEELGNNEVRLHLSTTYQLSTQFNGYGKLWVDYLLNDLEQYILDVIEGRAEEAMHIQAIE